MAALYERQSGVSATHTATDAQCRDSSIVGQRTRQRHGINLRQQSSYPIGFDLYYRRLTDAAAERLHVARSGFAARSHPPNMFLYQVVLFHGCTGFAFSICFTVNF